MKPTRLDRMLWWAVLAGVVGCGGSKPVATSAQASTESTAPSEEVASTSSEGAPTESAEPEAVAPRPDVPPEGSSLDRVMQAHFKDALLIREAVIAGKPEDAAMPADVIANLENLDRLPKGWQPFVENMKATARRVNNSTTSASVAAAVADLGVSCGLCHRQHGGPSASAEAPPATGTTLEERMQHHAWATERLWEGLSVPSSEAWNAGASALATATFPKELLEKGGVDVRTSAADFTHLATKASKQKHTEGRAAVYAELLVTCGTCHQATAH